ncbi:hemophore-related protein [Rhodococcus sp. NPDC055112]
MNTQLTPSQLDTFIPKWPPFCSLPNSGNGLGKPPLCPPWYVIDALYQRPDVRAAVSQVAPQIATQLAANPDAVQSINDIAGQPLLTDDEPDERNLAIAIGIAAAGYAVGVAMGLASRPK